MTVGELITELTKYKMDDEVYVSIDDKEKIGSIVNLTRWKGMCEIHFDNWTRTIEVPEGASNGDVLKKKYPELKVTEVKYGGIVVEYVVDYENLHSRFSPDWWNSPYRKEQE